MTTTTATPPVKTNPYEGMFLFPQAFVSDLDDALNHIRGILDKADAEIVAIRKWAERNLAFEIEKHKRGHRYEFQASERLLKMARNHR